MKRWLAALFLLFSAAPGMAQVDASPKVSASLVAEHDTVAPGSTLTVAVEEKIRPGWHTYWVNPGDAGAPTTITWKLPPGWKAGPIQWPYPKRLPVGTLMDFGYENDVWLLTQITVPADAKPGDVVLLAADANWLVCQEICVPEETSMSAPIAVDYVPNAPDRMLVGQFGAARARIPVAAPWPVHFHADKSLDLFLNAPALAAAKPDSVAFFPLSGGLIKGAEPQMLGYADKGIVVRMAPGSRAATMKTLDGVVVLTSADGSSQAIEVHATPGLVPKAKFNMPAPTLSIWLALLFAFIGGLILNVMPCVLPVLAMKVLSLANQSGAEKTKAREEGFAYGVGAILSFVAFGLLIVVLRGAGAEIGWGFQLQEPAVVAALAMLLFAVGLNLSGVFAFPTIAFGGSLAQRGGLIGAFFTGVLAVAVAAPCTAPFMATALGFALTQSAQAAIGVFFALGLGFALPFLLLAIWPDVLKYLPKPGPWMLTLERVLAVPMYLAALWLLWVLSQQASSNAVLLVLGAMVILGAGAYVWTATRNLDDRRRGYGAITALVTLLIALSAIWIVRGQTVPSVTGAASAPADISGIPSQPYTESRLADLRAANRPVFLNATAAWCITCLVNERAVLSQSATHDLFQKNNVAYLVADWTRRDPAITALLEKYGRPGVPLYLYYAPGKDARVLPQILTEASLEGALAGR